MIGTKLLNLAADPSPPVATTFKVTEIVLRRDPDPRVRISGKTDTGERLRFGVTGDAAANYQAGIQNGAWVAQGKTFTEWTLDLLVARGFLDGTVGDAP